jgi:hypothetical protein
MGAKYVAPHGFFLGAVNFWDHIIRTPTGDVQ